MYVTEEKMQAPEIKEYDYDALMSEFQDLAGKVLQKDANNGAKISQIIERYLGKGKRIVETSRDQAEFIYLIVSDMKLELL